MRAARTVQVVVPAGIGDPLRPSGGNTYDRRLCEELERAGWSVRVREVAGDWPGAGRRSPEALCAALAGAADGSVVLIDGLVASACPEAVVPATRRLRIVVLVHLPVGVSSTLADRAREAAVVRATAAVVTTSEWTRRWLIEAYGLDPARVRVAQPGVDAAGLPTGSADGGGLLCVGAVTAAKGHDALVAALARVADRPWRCVCVGPVDRAPDYVARLRDDLRSAGLADRVLLAGPRTGADLDAAYAAADLLVLASRTETYGMVVTEALARGLPVIAYDVGGISEALGTCPDGNRPGVLVAPGDTEALADALRCWLDTPALRSQLREAARRRRRGLAGWTDTAERVARVLAEVAA